MFAITVFLPATTTIFISWGKDVSGAKSDIPILIMKSVAGFAHRSDFEMSKTIPRDSGLSFIHILGVNTGADIDRMKVSSLKRRILENYTVARRN